MLLFFLFWTVEIFAAFNLTWGAPALSLDTNPPVGDTDSNAFLAMDAQGNAVATWSRTTGGGASENIWAAVYNHSLRTWTGALKISGEGSASHSQTAMDAEGNAIFVWEEGFPTRIAYRELSKNGIWTPDLSLKPATISSSKYGQTAPQIAMDSTGNVLLIWTEFFDQMHHIFSARKPSFSSYWSYLGKISSGTQDGSLISSKALVMNENGKGIAIWQESGNQIHAARYMNGNWLPPLLITANGYWPSLAMDSFGDAIIAWNYDHCIYSKTIQNEILSTEFQGISVPNSDLNRPSVALDRLGNAVIVFERTNSLHKFIASSTLTKGTMFWTTPMDISAPSLSNATQAGFPIISMNALGDGVSIWKEWAEDTLVVQGAGFSLGTWSAVKTLSSPDSEVSQTAVYDMSVAINSAGHILAIWPEDPQHNGTHQIKTTSGIGLANPGPLPPIVHPRALLEGVATGKQQVHKFPAHTDLINILSWQSVGNVDHFNIYRNNLATLIGSTTNTTFEDHQRVPKSSEIYLITAVDCYGHESSPMTIVVTP